MQVKVRALIWHGDQVIVAREETGLEIQVGRLLYVAECVNGYSLADVILIFTASATSEVDPERVELVHPDDAQTANVLPPVLDEVARDASGPPAARWLGNVYRPQSVTAA